MMRALRRHLFAPPEVALHVHGLRGGLLAFGTGMLLLLLLYVVSDRFGYGDLFAEHSAANEAPWVLDMLGGIMVAPLLETLILAWMLSALAATGMQLASKAALCGLI